MENFSTTKKVVSIDLVIPNPWNPNVQSEHMFKKGVQSVEEFGMLGSILVREKAGCYEILDGEHRYRYAKELGYKEIPIESIGELDDARAKVLTVMMNNLRGKDDIEKRSAIYESLSEGQLQLLPFTRDEIENEKKLFKFDFSQYQTTDPGIPADSLVKILSFKFTEDEWKVVEKGISIAKQDGYNEKQWFMGMLQNHLQVNLGATVGETVVNI